MTLCPYGDGFDSKPPWEVTDLGQHLQNVHEKEGLGAAFAIYIHISILKEKIEQLIKEPPLPGDMIMIPMWKFREILTELIKEK